MAEPYRPEAVYMLQAPPERRTTLLYGIKPRGLRTPDVESLHSYLLRLAFAHRLPPSKLVNMTLAAAPEVNACLDPSPRQEAITREVLRYGWGWGWGWDKHHGKSLIGVSPGAANWAKALSEATGEAGLQRCTLRGLMMFITDTGLLTDEPRICVDCLADDIRDGGMPYERLSWRMSNVSCCPRHRRPLIPAKCGRPASEALDPYLRVKHPGVCSGCGSIGFRCITDAPRHIGAGLPWRAQQIGAVLARSDDMLMNRHTQMKRFLRERFKDSGLVALGERAGACRSNFSDWINDKTGRTSLGQLLDLAAAEGVSLLSLMEGRWEPVPTTNQDRVPRREQKSTRQVPHEVLREAMTKALKEGRCASDVAYQFGIDTGTLANAHPDLYQQLRKDTCDRQQLEDEKRHREALEEAESIACRLLACGKVPSLRRASELTKSDWYPSQLRAQALMVIRHTLNKKAPPRNAKIGKAMVDAAAQVAQRLARESGAAPVAMAH